VQASGVPRLAPAGTQLERDSVMRLSFLPPAELSAEQKPLYEEMRSGSRPSTATLPLRAGTGRYWGPGALGYTIPISVVLSGKQLRA
jgi:hypothetical protein